jgi:hypothetical protein
MSTGNSSGTNPLSSSIYQTNHSDLQAHQPRANPMSSSTIQGNSIGLQTRPVQENYGPHNWNDLRIAAKNATRSGVNEWIQQARITGGVITTAPFVTTSNGSFCSSIDFEHLIVDALTGAGALRQVARGWANAVWKAWHNWASNYRLIHAPLFQGLANGHVVPQRKMSCTPLPMRVGISSRESDISNIKQSIRNNLYELVNEPGAAQAINGYSEWFINSFRTWQITGIMQDIIGQGQSEPYGFAPGIVIWGPVKNGIITCPSGFIKGLPFG